MTPPQDDEATEAEFLDLLKQVPPEERAALMFDCLLVAISATEIDADPKEAV